MPASFGIVPDEDDLGREIVIELNALAADGGETLVSRRVKTGFVPGEARLVRMLLYRACAEVSCADGESCGCPIDGACAAPSCIDETVQPDDMPLIDQPGILPPNAGMPKGRGGVIYCEAPLLVCGTDCVNPESDPRYCGDCSNTCPSGHVCEAGSCIDPGDCRNEGVSCTGFSYCDESSGECLPGCTESEQCSGKYELCDTSTHDCVCEPGLERCEEACVDTQSNPAFCGDCETSCPVGNECEAGVCKDPRDCRTNGIGCTGFTYCDAATGACLDGCNNNNQCTRDHEVCGPSSHACVCEDGFDRCKAGGPCHSEALVNIPGWCLLQP